jgi:hypothetical protein
MPLRIVCWTGALTPHHSALVVVLLLLQLQIIGPPGLSEPSGSKKKLLQPVSCVKNQDNRQDYSPGVCDVLSIVLLCVITDYSLTALCEHYTTDHCMESVELIACT